MLFLQNDVKIDKPLTTPKEIHVKSEIKKGHITTDSTNLKKKN